jgi:hypothetical protein
MDLAILAREEYRDVTAELEQIDASNRKDGK